MSVWVDHFSLAVRSLDEAEAFFSRYLPLVPLDGGSPGAEGEARARIFQLGHVKMALVESARSGGFIERFVQKRGEGIHHLALRTRNLDAISTSLEAAGLSPAHFSRRFTQAFGESPHRYLLTRRL